MSDLTTFRDHCRKMSTAKHKPECSLKTPGRWEPIRPHPGCAGCVTDADRALFALLASEVDEYLAPQPDLFGNETTEPTTEPEPTVVEVEPEGVTA